MVKGRFGWQREWGMVPPESRQAEGGNATRSDTWFHNRWKGPWPVNQFLGTKKLIKPMIKPIIRVQMVKIEE